MQRPVAFVIEDQMNLLMLYEDALRLVGYDVVPLRDGLTALNTLETTEKPPAFIILDINLPGLSGRDIHQHIRSRPKYGNVPVIILTANSLMANNLVPTMGKFDHLYVKPISMGQLQGLAKMMRPNPEGVPDYLADTQKIPHLDVDALMEMNTKVDDAPVALRPDDTITTTIPLLDESALLNEDERPQTGVLRPDDTLDDTSDAPIAQEAVKSTDETAKPLAPPVYIPPEADDVPLQDTLKPTDETDEIATTEDGASKTDTPPA